jgi:hypothetical protein
MPPSHLLRAAGPPAAAAAAAAAAAVECAGVPPDGHSRTAAGRHCQRHGAGQGCGWSCALSYPHAQDCALPAAETSTPAAVAAAAAAAPSPPPPPVKKRGSIGPSTAMVPTSSSRIIINTQQVHILAGLLSNAALRDRKLQIPDRETVQDQTSHGPQMPLAPPVESSLYHQKNQ